MLIGMMEPCPICTQLSDIHISFYKYAAPEYDRPLPEAAAKLATLPVLDGGDPQREHVRRCPQCGTFYHYQFSYEYHVNGSEDEEVLTRMTPDQGTDFVRAQAQLLEKLRGEIDGLEWNAGSLGDYIDRARPSPAEEEEARQSMEACRQEAAKLRKKLQEQVDSLRTACPEILNHWAAAHLRVCRRYLETLPEEGLDAQTARYVAQETLQAWEALPGGVESHILINTAWLEGYYEQLNL